MLASSQMADGTYKPGAEYGAAASNEVLRRLARTAPTYKRNRARICTFWLRNACTRTDCPFRPCNGDTDMPELNSDPALRTQNIKDRYHGVNDPVAEKMLRRAAASGADKALEPPEDPSVTTLFVGGLDERIDEESLKDHFYPFGEIASIRVVRDRKCAFVTFAARSAAEKAAEGLGGGALVVKGLRLKLMWGKPVAKREPGATAAAGVQGMPWGALPPGMPPGWGAPAGGMMMMPPPQMAGGAAGAYAAFYPSMDPAAMGTTRGAPAAGGAAGGAAQRQ
jgi:pre-mRNA-splicing factor RBM22/SLT11